MKIVLSLIVLALVGVTFFATCFAETPPAPPLGIDELVFVSGNLDNPDISDIYVVRSDGTNLQRLTDGTAINDSPDWSPDGELIVFRSMRDGNLEIYSMMTDGSDPQRLTNNPGADGYPAWSPDGQQILFTSCESIPHCTLHLMNRDGTQVRRLTELDGFDAGVSWSPDGLHIVASVEQWNGYSQLFVIAVDDSTSTQLTDVPAFHRYPAWSPDGQLIAFNLMGEGSSRLFVMNTNGSHLRLFPGAREDIDEGGLEWSADGTQVAFVSNRDGNLQVYVMNADGTDPRRLTNSPTLDFDPNWRPAAP